MTHSEERDDVDQHDDTAGSEQPIEETGSDGAGYPDGVVDSDTVPDFDADPDFLSTDELVYPTFSFETGRISPAEGFDLERELDGDELQRWLEDLAGAIGTHDLAIEGPDRRATFGVAPDDVRMAFEPDEDHIGHLSVTVTFRAKVMTYDGADKRPVGARGERGFIPRAMLTGDRDPDEFRCYNWIDEPDEDVDVSDGCCTGDDRG